MGVGTPSWDKIATDCCCCCCCCCRCCCCCEWCTMPTYCTHGPTLLCVKSLPNMKVCIWSIGPMCVDMCKFQPKAEPTRATWINKTKSRTSHVDGVSHPGPHGPHLLHLVPGPGETRSTQADQITLFWASGSNAFAENRSILAERSIEPKSDVRSFYTFLSPVLPINQLKIKPTYTGVCRPDTLNIVVYRFKN